MYQLDKRECDYEQIQSVPRNAINTVRFTTLNILSI